VESDVALLILRVWLAIVFFAHGINHGRTQQGTATWFASKGFKQAPLLARMSSLGELAVGAGLLLGLLTPFAAAGLMVIMVTAFWSVHRFSGFFVFRRPDEGYEYVVTLAVAALVLAILGPGAYSIDSSLGIADDFDGWLGAGIALAGIVLGFLQLAALWKKPANPIST
jgi:putative oxidoreductase